ncbi:MAG: DUF2889 domain-containing protein [Gammaproteobacteria bacterium]
MQSAPENVGTPLPTDRLTPPRRPGSVRRTLSIDMARPEGMDGRIVLHGRARDLRTGRDGDAEVIATSGFDIEVGRGGAGITRACVEERDQPALIGVQAFIGFRGALAKLPRIAPGSLSYQLLDDVPVATMITAYMQRGLEPRADKPGAYLPQLDVCAGWIRGGKAHLGLVQSGRRLRVEGPVGEPMDDGTDPLAWHAQAPLPAFSMRRRRRIDVWANGAGLAAHSVLRDVFVDADGRETLVHEYAIDTEVDADGRVTHSAARHGSLPLGDCPAAAPSAGRIVGTPIADLREAVRTGLRGTATCTHLNDSLRALADVNALAAFIDP